MKQKAFLNLAQKLLLFSYNPDLRIDVVVVTDSLGQIAMTRTFQASLLAGSLLAGGLAVLSPSVAWAGDHPFSIAVSSPTTVQSPGVVDNSGLVKAPLVLSDFPVPGETVTFGAVGQSLTPVKLDNVKMCKQGTGGSLEWLDQGPSLVGVTGTLSGDNGYTMELRFDAISSSPSGPCSSEGALSYTYTATATIKQDRMDVSGYENVQWSIWNSSIVGTVPEPGPVLLMLAALLSLIGLRSARFRASRRAGS